jgi:hypothetical protein
MLTPISPSQIDREVQQQRRLQHYVAQAPDLPLELLSARQFELLVHQLLEAERTGSSAYDSVSLLGMGADKGRDIVMYSAGKLIGVMQCKKYGRPINLRKVLRSL